MDSEYVFEKNHIIVFNIFLLVHRLIAIYRLEITRRHVLHFVLVYASINRSLVQIDLDAKFGASMSPFVCAHPWAALHACVRDVQPEDSQSPKSHTPHSLHLSCSFVSLHLFLCIELKQSTSLFSLYIQETQRHNLI